MPLTIHKAGFVHLIGKPNAGKSTLFNTLLNNPLSIVTPKPQTTRQDIIGITNTPSLQVIYVDTPGYVHASNSLQQAMVKAIQRTIPGADILLYVVDAREGAIDITPFHSHITHTKTFLLLNKADLLTKEELSSRLTQWKASSQFVRVLSVSARYGTHVEELVQQIATHLPEHPPFYGKEDITDKPMQFFVAELIRKVIFLQYHKEVPYSTAVVVTHYKQEESVIFVDATIYTERLSQKKILIGKHGSALEKLCAGVRGELSAFLGKKIFFKPHIKVLEHWRQNPKILQKWGYI